VGTPLEKGRPTGANFAAGRVAPKLRLGAQNQGQVYHWVNGITVAIYSFVPPVVVFGVHDVANVARRPVVGFPRRCPCPGKDAAWAGRDAAHHTHHWSPNYSDRQIV
jgi:hypothetical protein